MSQQISISNEQSKQPKENNEEEVGFYLRYLIGKQILKKYTQQMINSLRSRKYLSLTKNQFLLINDQSHSIQVRDQSIFQSTFKKNENNLFSNIIKRGINSIPLFSIDNKLIFLLNGIDMILYFILSFYFSIQMCFQSNQTVPNEIKHTIIIYIYLQLFLIFVQINTGVFVNGKYIKKRKVILQTCIRNVQFYSRISITLIFILIKSATNRPYLFIIILFGHYTTIFQFLRNLQEHVIQFQIIKQIVSLLVLLFVAFFIAHISSLVFISVGVFEIEQNEQSWIQQFLRLNRNNIQENQYQIYIASIHYIIVTMVTVGYGDIFPVTSTERLFNILIMIISSFVFAYIVNAVGQILSEIYNAKKESEYKKQIINSYMKKKNVSLDLQQQILQYLYYYWRQSKTSKCEEESQIINELSDELKQTLLMEAHKLVVQESAIFNQNFSESLLQKAVLHIQQINLYPQQTLFQVGEKDNPAIYFVDSGSVEKYITINEGISQSVKGVHVIQTIEKGMYFGVSEFFSGQKRKFNIRSQDFSTLLCIYRSDFLNLLKDFNDDFERFCDIKDTLQFSNGYNGVVNSCPSCKKQHSVDECPFLHYIPDKEKIIAKNLYNYQEKTRGIFQRKLTRHQSKNTYSQIYSVQSDHKKFVEHENETIQLYQVEYLFLEDDDEEDENQDNNNGNSIINQSSDNFQIKKSINVDESQIMINSTLSSDNIHPEINNERKNMHKLSAFIPQKSIQLQQQFSGQYFDMLQEESIMRNKKSSFINTNHSTQQILEQNQNNNNNNSNNYMSVNQKIKSPKKNNNQLDLELFSEGQNQIRISLPSITETSSSFVNQTDSQSPKRDGKNNTNYHTSYFNNNTNNNNINSATNISSFNPFSNINCNNQHMRIPPQEFVKKNSCDTSFYRSVPKFNRGNQKKNTNKTLFQQVELQIQKLQEQLFQNQQMKVSSEEDLLNSFEFFKIYTNYKVYFNVDQVLKRQKKYQISVLRRLSTMNFKHKILQYLNDDDSEYKKIKNEQLKLAKSTMNQRLCHKLVSSDKKNIIDFDLSSLNKQDSRSTNNNYKNNNNNSVSLNMNQKNQLFADFVFKLNSECMTNEFGNAAMSCDLKKSIDINQFSYSPNTIIQKQKEEKPPFYLDEILLDTSKSSDYSMKYLPQFNNLEILKKDNKFTKEIDINDTFRVKLQ